MNGKTDTGSECNLAPWWQGIYVLALIGFFLRLVVALVSENAYHADELFQLLEQGHRAVFGYGYIPWEFRFGTRSWIPPGLIGSILYFCKFLKLDQPSYYIPVVKGFFCLFSLSLIFSSYVIGRRICSEQAGRLSAFFVTFWYELVYFAHKPLTEVVGTYFCVAALACLLSSPSRSRAIAIGVLTALSSIFRLQYSLLAVFLLILLATRWNRRETLYAYVSFVVVIAWAGFIDFWTWGTPFISFYNNFYFNVVYGVSSKLFGVKPFYWYLKAFACSSGGLFILLFGLCFLGIRTIWVLSACVAIAFLSHSGLSHKEYRFIFVIIPLLHTVMAIHIAKSLLPRLPASKHMGGFIVLAVLFSIISFSGLFWHLPYQEVVYKFSPMEANTSLRSYKLLSTTSNVDGVLDLFSRHPFESGGYYYLHHDVPVYTGFHSHRDWAKPAEVLDFVSHVISEEKQPEDEKNPEHKLAVKRLTDRPPLRVDPKFTRNVIHFGIDDVYTPSVKRLL